MSALILFSGSFATMGIFQYVFLKKIGLMVYVIKKIF
jgi:hypothetical protein